MTASVIVRTEEHDGLLFVLPTWDPTPVTWNRSGSWAKDPDLEERVRAGLRAAVLNHAELAEQANTRTDRARWQHDPPELCRTYWGSHGCDLPVGHDGLCVCGPNPDDLCSAGLKYGTADTFILWWATSDSLELSEHHWTWFE